MDRRAELLQELERRQGSNYSPVNTEAPMDRRAELLQELAKREPGFMHRLGQMGRGVLSSIGASHEMMPHGGANLATMDIAAEPQLMPEEQTEDQRRISEAKRLYPAHELLPESADLGKEYEPEKKDTLGRVLKGTGEFLAPSPFMPLGGYGQVAGAAGKGLGALGKAVGKEVAISGGSSAAIHATPKLAEEGTGRGVLEDIGKGILGAKVAGKIYPKSAKELASMVPTKDATEAKKLFEAAERQGVELPPNVGIKSRALDFLANNVFSKGIFTSKSYDNMMERTGESMLNAWKKVVSSVSPKGRESEVVSSDFSDLLRRQEKVAEARKSELYEISKSKTLPDDVVYPIHTKKAIKELEDLRNVPFKSPAGTKATESMEKISKAWDLADEGVEPNTYNLALDLDKFPQLKGLANSKPGTKVKASDIINQIQQINETLDYDPSVKGSKATLKIIRDALFKDVEQIEAKNPEFLKAWKEAKDFTREEIAGRFRGRVAKSILTGETPKDALDMMNSPKRVDLLERSIGNTKEGKEIFAELKRAKLEQIFSGAITEEGIKVGYFKNLFNPKSKKAPLIRRLVGAPQYENLKDLETAMSAYQKSGKSVLNNSGTTMTTANVSTIGTLSKYVLGGLFGAEATMHPTVTAAAAASAVTGIVVTKATSSLFANSTFVHLMRSYITSRKQGNEQHAEVILARLMKMTESEVRVALKAAESQEEPKT